METIMELSANQIACLVVFGPLVVVVLIMAAVYSAIEMNNHNIHRGGNRHG